MSTGIGKRRLRRQLSLLWLGFQPCNGQCKRFRAFTMRLPISSRVMSCYVQQKECHLGFSIDLHTAEHPRNAQTRPVVYIHLPISSVSSHLKVANLKPSVTRIDEFLTAPISSFTSSAGGRHFDLERGEGDREMFSMSTMSNGRNDHRDSPSAASAASALGSFANGSSGSSGSSEHEAVLPGWRAEPWLTQNHGAPIALVSDVDVRDATFGYRAATESGLVETRVLKKLNFQVKSGSFVMIAGAVGSGKSTLLASLACARPALHGSCETKGRRAYVPQKPFLLNGTVRENIIFGLPLDEERYNSALEMSALPDDLKTLTDGDATLVGESGV